LRNEQHEDVRGELRSVHACTSGSDSVNALNARAGAQPAAALADVAPVHALAAGGALRFCMITTFYPPYNFGGDGIGIQRLSRALVRRGHHVTVVHDEDSYLMLNGGREPSMTEESDGVEVVGLRSRMGALTQLFTHQTGRPVVHGAAIRRLLDNGRFDVINFHNISLVGGPGVLSAGRGLKVMTAHEHWLVCPSHVLWRHDREPCTGRECTRCVLAYRRPPQLWRYTGYLERQLENVDLFIAKSEFSRDKHHEFGFSRPMEVMPYFLPDQAAEHAPPAASPHQRPFFLFVGRLERIKGLEDVIDAFRRFDRADLLVAGTGTHETALRERAAGINHVRFLGRLNAEQLAAHYAHALALVVPSVGFETFGIILIEAFRSALPVIARRMGPFPEIVERAQGGLLFSTQDELVEALETLERDGVQRARIAQNGRAAFLEHWSEPVVVPRYLELLRTAAEQNGYVRTARLLSNEVMS
jgi:glycosyltransferase involved in cell wall biosynthesis